MRPVVLVLFGAIACHAKEPAGTDGPQGDSAETGAADTDPVETGDTNLETGDTDPVETGDTDPVETGDTDPVETGPTAPLASSTAVLLGEAESDGAGASVSGAGDLDGDGLADLAVLAAGKVAIYVAYGPVVGTSNLANAPTLLDMSGTDAEIVTLAGGADLTGDGLTDVLVGRYADSFYDEEIGGAYLFPGPCAGTLTTADAIPLVGETSHFYVQIGDYPYSNAGAALATGDLDGDGATDAVVGDTASAGIYGVPGPIASSVALVDMPAAHRTDGDLGDALAVADADGDGFDDVFALGIRYDGAGAVVLLPGPPTAWSDVTSADALVLGDADHLPYAIAAGDVDGDGLADLVLGFPYDATGGDTAGSVRIFTSPVATGTTAGAADATLLGAEDDSAGQSVAVLDPAASVATLLVGGTNYYPVYATAGKTWIAHGIAGTVELLTLPTLTGSRNQQAGYSVAGAGDVDGDGFADVLVGGPGDDTHAIDAGVAWLLSGASLP
ncbi:MAG: VCBS repeat-containing protein [Myxococcota bacterium]